MKSITKNLIISLSALVLSFSSCSTDEGAMENQSKTIDTKDKSLQKLVIQKDVKSNFSLDESEITSENAIPESLRPKAVEETECDSDTEFRQVLIKYDNLLADDFLSIWDGSSLALGVIIYDYPVINQFAARYENYNADTFGDQGQYTPHVNRMVKNMEKFWNMPDMIQVRGQHSSTLEDYDFLRYMYENYTSLPEEVIVEVLDIAKKYNDEGVQIPENPWYTADGFATFDRIIVIGDGLVDMVAETGLDTKVVWSSILAHEWAHQIQFLNYGYFEYPVPPFIGTAESTRMTELEADFYTGFYLTHKRGGTYNWKRIEDVLENFYQIGDCGFESGNHHGTHAQRMKAAELGYELAASIKKNGKIQSQEQIHEAFLAVYDDIIAVPE